MKILSFSALFLSIAIELSFASSISTPVTRSISDLKGAVMVYKMEHEGHLPINWKDFISSGALSGEILDSAKKYLDVENRYAFVNTPNVFNDIGGLARIIIMAKQPGGEGDQVIDSEDGQSTSTPGRWLILETAKGDLYMRRYTEEQLESKFTRAGLSLKDYTSDAPAAPKIEPRSKPIERAVEEQSIPKQKSRPIVESKEHERKGKPADVIPTNQTWLVLGGIAGLFTAALAAWKIFKNKHNSNI